MLKIIVKVSTHNWRIDMNYIDFMKNGGIHIKEKNKGKFTESAKRAGESVQEHATSVLNDPNATRLQKRRAQFAKNAKQFHHKDGGILFEQTGGKALATGIKTQELDTDDLTLNIGNDEAASSEEISDTTAATQENKEYDWIASKIQQYTGLSEGKVETPTYEISTTGVVEKSTPVQSFPSSATTSDPRGFRNNNWLNIRISNNAWQGKKTNNTDGAFEQFETPELGIRAAAKNIKTYASSGLNTVKKIISTWAPASDNNNTSVYVSNVARRMGVNPDQKIDVNDQNTMIKLLAAMTISENGREGDISVIQRGVAMA